MGFLVRGCLLLATNARNWPLVGVGIVISLYTFQGNIITWLPDRLFILSVTDCVKLHSGVHPTSRLNVAPRISTLAHLLISQQVVWGEMEVLQCCLLLGKPEGLKPAFIWSYFNKGGSLILLICPFFFVKQGPQWLRCIDVSCPADKDSSKASLTKSHEGSCLQR